MYTPVLRMVAAALSDPTLGVAAKLQDLELDDPSDDRPEAPNIIVPPDNDLAAQGPPTSPSGAPAFNWPLLVVTCEMPAPIKATGVVGKAIDATSLKVSIVYATQSVADAAKAWRAADYTFRCCVFALNDALFASGASAARQRGKIQIHGNNSMSYGPAYVALDQAMIVGQFTLDLYVRMLP